MDWFVLDTSPDVHIQLEHCTIYNTLYGKLTCIMYMYLFEQHALHGGVFVAYNPGSMSKIEIIPKMTRAQI